MSPEISQWLSDGLGCHKIHTFMFLLEELSFGDTVTFHSSSNKMGLMQTVRIVSHFIDLSPRPCAIDILYLHCVNLAFAKS